MLLTQSLSFKGDAPDLALTVMHDRKPIPGLERITFVEMCKQNSKGIFILVKTPILLLRRRSDCEGGRTMRRWRSLLTSGAAICRGQWLLFCWCCWGATYPEQAERIRKLFLAVLDSVPGYGTGGNAKSVVVNFNDDGLGAVVNASRSILYAYKSDRWSGAYDEDAYADAARAEAVYMRDEINMELEKRQK